MPSVTILEFHAERGDRKFHPHDIANLYCIGKFCYTLKMSLFASWYIEDFNKKLIFLIKIGCKTKILRLIWIFKRNPLKTLSNTLLTFFFELSAWNSKSLTKWQQTNQTNHLSRSRLLWCFLYICNLFGFFLCNKKGLDSIFLQNFFSYFLNQLSKVIYLQIWKNYKAIFYVN